MKVVCLDVALAEKTINSFRISIVSIMCKNVKKI